MRFTAIPLAVFLLVAAAPEARFDLDATFRSVLEPEQARALSAGSGIESLARTFSPRQHQAARARLREAEEQTRDPRALSEIHRGYLALKEAEGAWRVGDAMVSRFPDSPAGYTMRGQAAELRGDVALAAEEAREALRRDPDDRAAHALLRLTEGRSSTANSVLPPAAADGAVPTSGGFLAAPRSGASAEALSLMRQAVRAREEVRMAREAGDTARAAEEMARVLALAQAAMNGDPKSAVAQGFYGLVQKDRERWRREQVGLYAALERRKADEHAQREVAAELEAARRAARRRAVPPLVPLGAGAVLLTLGLMTWERGLRDAARAQVRQFAAGSLIVLGCAGVAYGASALIFSAPRTLPPAVELAGNAGVLGRATVGVIAKEAAPAAVGAGTAAAPLLMKSDETNVSEGSSANAADRRATGSETRVPTDQEITEAASRLDSADRGGGLTRAGRSLTKHNEYSRAGSRIPRPTGNPERINESARRLVESILKDPDRSITIRESGRFGKIIEIRRADGVGVRLREDNLFLHFIE